MPEPTPCKPHVRSSGSSVGRVPEPGCAARFSREHELAAEMEKTPTWATDQNDKERKPAAGGSRLPAWRHDLQQVGTRFVMNKVRLCAIYPFSLSSAPPMIKADGDAGVTKILLAPKINPNSGLRPSDTRSHGFQRSFSLFSDRPFPTSTGRDYSPRGRADQDQSAVRGDWPRNAGIP